MKFKEGGWGEYRNLSIPDGVTSLGEDGALSSQRFKNLIEIEIKYYLT